MPSTSPHDPCLLPGIQPLLSELKRPVSPRLHSQGEPGRAVVEHFISRQFERRYGARLGAFYPRLLSFASHRDLRAAVGIRDTLEEPLFAEQYLQASIERLITEHWGQSVDRATVAEVGNLVLAKPGEARWVIAAVTTFLHACGYRWVLFTAVPALFNAFQRLGLNPVRLATASPDRLPDGGRDWGRYYEERPIVCVGDIASGQGKLGVSLSAQPHPALRQLLSEVHALAAPARRCQAVMAGCAG